MTFTELQARATLLASFEGWSDVSPSPDWAVLVNRAWRQFSWDAEVVVGTTTFATVNGTAHYALSGYWKELLDVVYDSAGTPAALYRTEEDFERGLNPLWRVTTGTPARWSLSGFGVLTLTPVPSAAVTCSVRGIAEGAAMTTGTDLPGQVGGSIPATQQSGALPETFHEAIAIRAAWLQGKVYSQGEASARLQDFNAEYNDYVQRAFDAFWHGTRARKAVEAL